MKEKMIVINFQFGFFFGASSKALQQGGQFHCGEIQKKSFKLVPFFISLFSPLFVAFRNYEDLIPYLAFFVFLASVVSVITQAKRLDFWGRESLQQWSEANSCIFPKLKNGFLSLRSFSFLHLYMFGLLYCHWHRTPSSLLFEQKKKIDRQYWKKCQVRLR